MTDFKRLEQAFADIEKLDENWDSYGAKKPSEKTIETAKNFIYYNMAKFSSIEIEPNKDGSITVEVAIR